jgi:hypothetical protein
MTALSQLDYFTGTESYYKHPFTKSIFTDGVKYVADNAGAYWLIDFIVFKQIEDGEIGNCDFQVWTLDALPDNTAMITCTDGDYEVLLKEKVDYTDFPVASIKLYYQNNVLMLASEY